MATSEPGSSPQVPDVWADGAAYERYVGRWSRVVAREFLAWLAPSSGGHWLDVGCGTGALSQAILEATDPAAVHGVDRSAGFVELARRQVPDPLARFDTGDARSLPVESAAYDAVVSGLVLNFVPEPALAVQEMARAARAGGLVALYVWDYAEGMQFMRFFWDAALALDPRVHELDEGLRFPLCRPQPLTELFGAAGLQQVKARPIEIATTFRDFDDFWTPFLGGNGSAPSYVATLSDAGRAALRERLRETLPAAPDGSLHLLARAWAVRGQRST